MDDLGTVLMIWAHPDDETYLAGGLSHALIEAGHRVVCLTATRGEAGGTTDGLGEIRTAELESALRVLGVDEHHWLDHPDGGCAAVDPEKAAAEVRAILDDVRPDTVITFGPDGFTGHPDHQAVSAWTDLAVEQATMRPRVLHAVRREEVVDRELDEDFGVFDLGLPRVCSDDELAIRLDLNDALLDRKVEALLHQVSQTGGLVETVGLERFRAWVATESFADPRDG